MADILIRNLSQETIDRLKERARKHRRSLQAEAAVLLEEEMQRDTNRNGEFFERARALRATMDPSIQTDSAEIIRNDRDTDHGHTR